MFTIYNLHLIFLNLYHILKFILIIKFSIIKKKSEKEIESSKIDLHEGYCRRNITNCEICKIKLMKDQLDDHKLLH